MCVCIVYGYRFVWKRVPKTQRLPPSVQMYMAHSVTFSRDGQKIVARYCSKSIGLFLEKPFHGALSDQLGGHS